MFLVFFSILFFALFIHSFSTIEHQVFFAPLQSALPSIRTSQQTGKKILSPALYFDFKSSWNIDFSDIFVKLCEKEFDDLAWKSFATYWRGTHADSKQYTVCRCLLERYMGHFGSRVRTASDAPGAASPECGAGRRCAISACLCFSNFESERTFSNF